MANLLPEVDVAYDTVRAPDDEVRYVSAGEAPVIRDGQRGYEALETLNAEGPPCDTGHPHGSRGGVQTTGARKVLTPPSGAANFREFLFHALR
jgi:hypothetical protein